MKLFVIFLVFLLAVEEFQCTSVRRAEQLASEKYLIQAKAVLDRVPLVDGHNDFAHTLRDLERNQVEVLDITDLTNREPWTSSVLSQTDINRLRQGKVGGQFWSAFVDCETQYKDALVKTWEQIDVIHRMVKANPDTFEFVTSAQGIEDAFSRGKIGSLIGVEGGHSVGNSLAVLRMMYSMGVRYLTLTHTCPTPWADNSEVDDPGNTPTHNGLTPFGKILIAEMNRLGMLVDLAHVSRKTMRDAVETSTAPVIFSHSSAYALCNNTRNVPDDILTLVAEKGGVVMVNFYPYFITCSAVSTLKDVADHIDHIRNVAGVDHVGMGSDYNGIPDVPIGLEDTSKFPDLFAELLARGWSETDLEKLASGNLLRVFRGTEAVRDQMAADGVKPFEEWIPQTDLPEESQPCSTGEY